MNSDERRTEIVHDLMHIQQKRMVAYERAMKYCSPRDSSVCELLRGMVAQSRQCITELRCHTAAEHGEPADRAELKGDIYRDWPEINYFSPGNTTYEIVHCCGYIEKTTTQAYKRALEKEELFDNELRQLIHHQLAITQESFESVYAHMGMPSAPEITGEERMPCGFFREGVFSIA
jgi:uncharacterized protein (TIGR02284 family)